MRWRILTAAVAHTLDADAVVVVDSGQGFEYIDVNGGQIRIYSLKNGAVAVDDVLSAGFICRRNSSFQLHVPRLAEYRFQSSERLCTDWLAAPENATVQRVGIDYACPYKAACGVVFGAAVVEGAGDFIAHVFGERRGVECRRSRQKYSDRISVARMSSSGGDGDPCRLPPRGAVRGALSCHDRVCRRSKLLYDWLSARMICGWSCANTGNREFLLEAAWLGAARGPRAVCCH